MIDLSRYVFEALRKDEEFILYRGRSEDAPVKVLVLSPVVEYPTPESLKRLEHAYSLREELNPRWAARPIAMACHWDRTVLVLEDPGGVPLDQVRPDQWGCVSTCGGVRKARSASLPHSGQITWPPAGPAPSNSHLHEGHRHSLIIIFLCRPNDCFACA